jgi:hypothetical protein
VISLLLKEFIELFCDDIIKKKREANRLFNDYGWPYDEIAEDDNGDFIKIIHTGSEYGDIPLRDIIDMNRVEFAKVYPSQEALDAYDLYVESVGIIDGEELLDEYRKYIKTATAALEKYSDILP